MPFPFENGILKKYLFSMLHFLFDKPLCFEYNKVTLYFSRNGDFMYIRRHLEEQVKLASKNYPVVMVRTTASWEVHNAQPYQRNRA